MLKILSILLLLSTFIFANEKTYSKEQIEKMIAKMVILGFTGEKVLAGSSLYRNIKDYDFSKYNPRHRLRFKYLSENPGISIPFIYENPDLDWDWGRLSKNLFNLDPK